jgi:glutaredoxin
MSRLSRALTDAASAGGALLAGIDRRLHPQRVERTPEEQQRVDALTRRLVMYEFLACPFCMRTRRAMRRLSLDIETRDALHNPTHRRELLEGGGRIMVPCLRITREDGSHDWLYESADIIAWLERSFA